MSTKISYLYRDAGNYKRYNECIIAGTLSAKQIRAILDCCDMSEYFIPRQVGLPEHRLNTYDPQTDHCWLELGAASFSETRESPTMALTATDLVNRFEECRNNWQDEAYTPQIGEMNL